jgi:hypothetical protein
MLSFFLLLIGLTLFILLGSNSSSFQGKKSKSAKEIDNNTVTISKLQIAMIN